MAYNEPVTDPSDFAQDVNDLVGAGRRPARVWNTNSSIILARTASTASASPQPMLHVINYGSPVDRPVLAQIQGRFATATAFTPDREPFPLPVAKRGSASEVVLPELRRVAVITFRCEPGVPGSTIRSTIGG